MATEEVQTELVVVRHWQEEFERGIGTSRILGIVGPPGVGKTTLANLVCTRKEVFKVGASFFFKHDNPQTSSVRDCIFSLARQLGLVVAQEALEETEDIKRLFRVVLSQPLLEQVPSNKPHGMIVVIDGLDESDDIESMREIVVESWAMEMPSWLGLLFTSRSVLDLNGVKVHTMSYDSESNQTSIKSFLRSKFTELGFTSSEVDESVKFVAQKSAGFPVYSRELARTLDEGNLTSLFQVCELITSTKEEEEAEFCDTVYRGYFRRLLARFQGDFNRYRRVFSLLAVSRARLSHDVLASILESDIDAVRKALEILVEDEQGRLAFPHQSMKGFLLNRARSGRELHVPAREGHEQMVAFLMKDPASPLALHHLMFHLCVLKEWSVVRAFMLDFDWLTLLVSEDGAAQRVVEDLDHLYISRGEVADIHVTDVVRALGLAFFYIGASPAYWNSESLSFQILGRITDPTNPVLESCMKSRTALQAPSLPPLLPYFQPARTALRYALKTPVDSEHVFSVSFDGADILAITQDFIQEDAGEIKVYDVRKGTCTCLLKGHKDNLSYVKVGGSILVSSAKDGTVRIWDMRSGACLQVLQKTQFGTLAAVASNGEVVVSRERFRMRVWDWRSRTWLQDLKGPHKSKGGGPTVMNGDILASRTMECTVTIWNWRTGACLQVLQVYTDSVATIAMDGDVLVTSSYDGDHSVRVWNWRAGVCLQELAGHRNSVVALAIDGALVVSGSSDRSVRVWDWETGVCMQALCGFGDLVHLVAMENNLMITTSGAEDSFIKVWDVAQITQGESIVPSNLHEKDSCAAVAFSSTGEHYISGSRQGRIWITETRTGKPTHAWEGPKACVRCVGFVDECSSITSAVYNDETVRVRANNGKLLQEFVIDYSREGILKWALNRVASVLTHLGGHPSRVSCVAMDGDTLISGSVDATVQIWDVQQGKCIRMLRENSSVTAVAIDLAVVVSVARFHVKVWDRKTGKCLHVLPFDNRQLYDVRIAKDSLVASDYRGTVYWWDRSSWNRSEFFGGEPNTCLAVWEKVVWCATKRESSLGAVIRELREEESKIKVMGTFDNHVTSIAVKPVHDRLNILAVVEGHQDAVLLSTGC